MASDLPLHRAKLKEMFAFWGWQVREQDLHLAWHVEDVIELAVWAVFHRVDNGVSREWVISEPTGMLPIDHLSANGLPNAPSALREFAARWQVIANDRLEDHLSVEKIAELRRTKPQILAQAQQMREMIGMAAELLFDCAIEAGPNDPVTPPTDA